MIKPKTTSIKGWLAIGTRKLKTKSTRPAEKLKPAVQWKSAAMNIEIPVKAAWTTYKGQATNMNENSRGSVTPVKNEAKAAASINEAVAFLFSGRD